MKSLMEKFVVDPMDHLQVGLREGRLCQLGQSPLFAIAIWAWKEIQDLDQHVSFFIHIFSSLEWQPCRFFENSRGLHQGETLSSLFFILVMELLCKMIDRAVEEGCQGLIVEQSNGDTLATCPTFFALHPKKKKKSAFFYR